jgi:beta-glucosidase
MRYIALALASSLGLSACATVPSAVPANTSPVASAEDLAEAEVADLVSRMSLERKIGQLIQPQINSFTPQDMERYRFGSYLNGGNGGPYGDEFAPASEWLRHADEMYDASVKPLPDGEPIIPTMWGTDAVHGHSNIVGATIFPHNIALGATGDAELVQRIGHATAIEIEVTGIDWNFSPTVAVARDDRWGRTYESYSEDPDLVAKLGAALIVGQQGSPGSEDFLGDGRVFVTAKHFFGDGGTEQGVDQGDVNGDINALLDLHGRPYPAAIDAGVQAVMASFNSINGRKMHGNKELLTDVLRGQMGFDGLVVGDWNGHAQIKGCTVTDCPQSLMAGLDIYMVPDEWKVLMETLIAQVKDGTIPMARVDEAVTRVLRVKQRAGLLGENAKRPSERGVAGQYDLLASPEHRALAREAVAKSQVLLKNDGVLPLKPRDYFPKATSIWDGIKENVTAEGGSATLSEDGSFEARPDIAIVVFGEHPYAEFAGDQRNLVFRDEEGLTLLRQFDEQDIPTVAVFLSGRAMWMNREINAADAFVASWLPGSEGAGVADVLTGKREATGRLSFSWPASCEGQPVNSPEGALFAFGFGRTLSDNSPLATLNEDCGALSVVEGSELFGSGRLGSGVSAFVGRLDGAGFEELMPQMRGDMNGSGVLVRGFDRDAQEDSREITMRAGSYFGLEQSNNTGGVYRIAYEVVKRPAGTIRLRSGNAVLDVTAQFELATAKGFREMVVTESCLAGLGKRIAFESDGDVTFRISSVKREEVAEGTECSF